MKRTNCKRVSISIDRLSQIDKELQSLSNTLGVELERQVLRGNDSFEVSLRLAELPKPIGLSILIAEDYFSWHVELKLDSYSDGLISFMRKSLSQRYEEIESLVERARAKNTRVNLSIDGKTKLRDIAETDWSQYALIIAKSYKNEEDSMKSLNEVLFDFMCILLLFLTIKVDWDEESHQEPRAEGGLSFEASKRYERSRVNRAICLRRYGFRCMGCGILLQEIYGPIGANVIHVHHIVPVSQMGGSYVLNPESDLIPLCPNCHNIVHRIDPPLSIDALRDITAYDSELSD